MTLQEWITLIVAILGVLHGPLSAKLLSTFSSNKGTK